MRTLPLLFLLFLPLLCGNSSISYAESEAIVRQGKDYALFFAVDDYSANRNFNNLPDPIASAQKLATELSEMYDFQTEIVRNPTKDQIYRKLQEYRGRTFGKDDQLLVFFSGHGDFDDFEVKG